MSDDTLVYNGAVYTFRTAAEIKDLVAQSDKHYAAGRMQEGDDIRTALQYTALRPTKYREGPR
jgi:hypothetical protein